MSDRNLNRSNSKTYIMDSINNNQEEENYKDLSGEEGIKKMKELIDKAGSCFFCTSTRTATPFNTRPMSVAKMEEDGTIWFFSSSDSNKNMEIVHDTIIQLLFQGSAYSDFLSITGEGEITTDKGKIKELWDPMMKTWFTEGEDDPRITLIKFTPTESYYWDTKHAMGIGFVKRMIGAAVGKTMDDSIEGNIIV